jgi:cell division GTPase FtsZ
MNALAVIAQYAGLLSLAAVALAFFYAQFKNGKDTHDDETVRRLRDAYESVIIENKELRKQIGELQTAVKLLQESNLVLQNIVTGKETLISLQGSLTDNTAKLEVIHSQLNVIIQKLELNLERRHPNPNIELNV